MIKRVLTAVVLIALLAALPARASFRVNQLAGFGAGSTGTVSLSNTDSPTDGTSASTYNLTANIGAEASDRIVVVAVNAWQSGAGSQVDVSSVTVGGVSATLRAKAQYDITHTLEVWTAPVPTGTTGVALDVVFDQTVNRMGAGVFRMVGAASAAPNDSGSATGTGTTLSAAVDVPASGSVLGVTSGTRNASVPTVTWTGVTEAYDEATAGGAIHSGGAENLTAVEFGRTVQAVYSAAPDAGAQLIAVSWGP